MPLTEAQKELVRKLVGNIDFDKTNVTVLESIDLIDMNDMGTFEKKDPRNEILVSAVRYIKEHHTDIVWPRLRHGEMPGFPGVLLMVGANKTLEEVSNMPFGKLIDEVKILGFPKPCCYGEEWPLHILERLDKGEDNVQVLIDSISEMLDSDIDTYWD